MNDRMLGILSQAFLDNITLGALFGRLRRPGAPEELVDEREIVDEKPIRAYLADLYTGHQTKIKRQIQRRLRKAIDRHRASQHRDGSWRVDTEAEDVARTVYEEAELVEHCS
jgi:hypothetical protein